LLLDDVEQFFVAVFRHDDLFFLSPTRRKVLRSCPTIEQTCCLCHRRPLSTGRVHYKSDCADFMLDSLRSLGAPAPSCLLGSKR
jgi:hypothetical protein